MNRSTYREFLGCFRLAGILFLMPVDASSQSYKPNSTVFDGHSFATIPIADSLPSFPPIRRKLVSETRHSAIVLADTLGTVYVCQGKDAQGRSLFFLLHHRHDQNWTLSTLDFPEDTTVQLRTSIDLRPLTGRETPFPFEIRLDLPKRLLYYRWLLSPDVPGLPGGLPTPANALLDVGKSLFDFALSDLSGKPVRSSELRGKVTVIDWWATWCSACVAEIAGYNELVRKYQSNVDFLAIAMNTSGEVKGFLAKHPFLFRQTVATDSMFRLIGSGIPRTIVLNKQGVVEFDHAGGGVESYKDIQKAIEAVLAKKGN